MYIYNFCNVDKDGTSQLGIRKLVLLENATQELLNMKGELEENDKLYKLKYNSSGYIYFKYKLSCSKKFIGRSFGSIFSDVSVILEQIKTSNDTMQSLQQVTPVIQPKRFPHKNSCCQMTTYSCKNNSYEN